MDIIFNKDSIGDDEVKRVLGFTDADFKFDHLITDIKLETPYLIDYIGSEVYELALYTYNPDLKPGDYSAPTLSETQTKLLDRVIALIQAYLLLISYHSYSQSSDLIHTNAGRKNNRTGDQTTPWEWQIDRDNAIQLKKAYKALDHLIKTLDDSEIEVWKNSEAYKKSKKLFIHNTAIFDDVFSINKSGQLYYRMVPFMNTIELEYIFPILQETKFNAIKAAILAGTPSNDKNEQRLLELIRNAVAYLTLAKAYKTFPVEMFPDKINYQENTTMKAKARVEVMQSHKAEGEAYLIKLEDHYAKMTATRIERDPMSGLKEENKHVSL
ncbi:DUF6712 family protein [Aquimarina sp. W85]|uniref:DUF6712 family protein n=1 Tax=Aquimarina rhodophyticola TaxID=3342246 RepID=UPI003670B714